MTDEEIKAEYEILDRAKQNPAAFIVGARLQRVPSMLFIQSILSLSRKVDVETTYHSIVEQVNLLDPFGICNSILFFPRGLALHSALFRTNWVLTNLQIAFLIMKKNLSSQGRFNSSKG